MSRLKMWAMVAVFYGTFFGGIAFAIWLWKAQQ